tara:strand:- start:2466 stop:2945 length:480 start_codon:yes stop_codon:yes gene_type:complete
MATGENRASASVGLNGAGLQIAIVHARWNTSIVDRLLEGALRGLEAFGAKAVGPVAVPGCFELPMACRVVASSGKVDAVIAIGAVIRGETTHYEIVSEGCASGIQQAQLEVGVPITFGVLTVESTEQAIERSQGPGSHNVGEEAAVAAIEMARLVNDWA